LRDEVTEQLAVCSKAQAALAEDALS